MELTRDLSFRFPLMRGEDVRAVQQALTVLQTSPPCGVADGIFGNATRLAVMSFQRKAGLHDDGVVGINSWAAMFGRAVKQQEPLIAAGGKAAPLIKAAATTLPPKDMPLTQAQAIRARDWMMQNFGPQIEAAIANSPIDSNLVCAIAGKETAQQWLGWTTRVPAAQVLERCVFDASGDFPGTSRSAFPRNTAAFRAKVGDDLTDTLIAEANETRRLRGMSPEKWVYKGYGILQYDLQHFDTDPDFFTKKQWRDMTVCMDRFMREMNTKLAAANGDLRDAIRRYNGSGPRAEQYAEHVLQLYAWLQ